MIIKIKRKWLRMLVWYISAPLVTAIVFGILMYALIIETGLQIFESWQNHFYEDK